MNLYASFFFQLLFLAKPTRILHVCSMFFEKYTGIRKSTAIEFKSTYNCRRVPRFWCILNQKMFPSTPSTIRIGLKKEEERLLICFEKPAVYYESTKSSCVFRSTGQAVRQYKVRNF